ncbi:MAG: PAS domain S-box protein [Cytophagales bacterium]|nr:MAG: PAS domain S-box protein [Cytophagales bacterium]
MLQSSNNFLSDAIFNQATDAFIVVDPEFKVLVVNQAFSEIINTNQRDIKGVNFFDLLNLNSDQYLLNSIKNYIVSEVTGISFSKIYKDTNSGKFFDLQITKVFAEQNLDKLLFKMSEQVNTSIENESLSKNRLKFQNDALFEINRQTFWQEGDLDECFRMVTKLASQVLDISNCGIWLFEGEHLECKLLYSSINQEFLQGFKLEIKNFPIYIDAIKNQGIIDASDAWNDPRSREFVRDYFVDNNIKSTLDAGIKYSNETVGVFCCEQVSQKREWSLDEINFVVYLCEIISHTISSKKEKEFRTQLVLRERYYKSLIDNSIDVISIVDENGLYTFFSPSLLKYFGYEVHELIGKSPFDYIHQDDLANMIMIFENLLYEYGKEVSVDYRFKHKDGHWVDTYSKGKNMLNIEGVKGIVVNTWDISDTKAAEKEIIRKEKYFRLLTENSFDVRYTADSIGIVTYVSPSIYDILGYYPEEILGNNGWKFIAESSKSYVKEEWAKLCANPQQMIYLNSQLIRKDGTYIEVELIAKNMLDDPDINGVIITFRDITERALYEKKISESEEYFRSLIENSNDAMTIINKEGLRTYVSPSSEKVFGYSVEELMGKSPFVLLHPDDIESTKQYFEELLKVPEMVTTIQVRINHPIKKDWITIEITAKNLLHNSVVNGIVLNSRDITETKLAQQKLAISEKYYRSLIENSNDMLAICDSESNFKYASPSVERFMGYTNEEYLSSNLKSYIHKDFVKACDKVLEKSLEHPGVTFKQELYQRNHSGHYIYLETIFNNLLHDEAVKGIVMVSRDVSDRKNAELILQNYNMQLSSEVSIKTQELKNKNSELETLLSNLKVAQAQLVQSEKMASLGLLTAGIAHEINNPINFITSNINPLKRDIMALKEYLEVLDTFEVISDSQKVKEIQKIKTELEIDYAIEEIDQLLNGIEEGAKRTSEIIKGLRNFSRLDEQDLKMDDINQSLNTTLMLLYSNYNKKVKVKKNFSKLPLVECYPGKLNQVFMNIISNAFQSITDIGEVLVSTFFDKEINKVIIMIEDNGIGMTNEVMERIFEPFYTNKKVGEGTGLGLFISFGIIDSHHGKIEVESEMGKGSKFIISLPVAQG